MGLGIDIGALSLLQVIWLGLLVALAVLGAIFMVSLFYNQYLLVKEKVQHYNKYTSMYEETDNGKKFNEVHKQTNKSGKHSRNTR